MSLLESAHPERSGHDPALLTVADHHIRNGVEQSVYPAAVFMVTRHGRVIHHAAFGSIGDGKPTPLDAVFDLASITKPHVALCLLKLIEEGVLWLTQSVGDFFPEISSQPLGKVTLRELATHTSGLPAWKALYKTPGHDEAIKQITSTALVNAPGSRYTYSDLGYILIGEIIGRVTSKPLQEVLHQRLTVSLGLPCLGYLPSQRLSDRTVPTANEPSRPGATMVGSVHDGNAFGMGGVAGHAGLFGTAADLAMIANALVGDGHVGKARLLGLPTLRLVRQRQIPETVGGHSIGWFTAPNGMLPRGDILDDTSFGHTGFTGTMLVCNPGLQLGIILLTNRVMNPTENSGMSRIRRQVVNAVAASVIA